MSVNVRVATMTLLVFVEDASLIDWARERARLLAQRHASRVVVLNATTSDTSAQNLDGEWIEFGVRGSTPEHLLSVTAPVLTHGVQHTLLWVARMTASDARFDALMPEMQTILLDSSRVSDDAAALRDLVAFRKAHPENGAIHDLAYLRLAPWQELVADFFDERNFVEDLFNLKRVTVASGSDAEGYYLLGWLASRLEWEPTRDRTFTQRRSGRTVAYAIEREGRARRVNRVTLESQATHFRAELCGPDSTAVSLEVSGAKRRAPRVAPLHDVDIASLLERAILRDQADPVFRDALDVAGRMLG